MKRILIVAPHPDDDLIGCGGSIAKHIEENHEVFVVYITNGAVECQEFSLDELIPIRKKETLSAAQAIGLKEKNLFFLEEHPWKLDGERIRLSLLKLVRKIQPDFCYVPHISEAHVDHRLVGQLAIDAITMGPSKWFKGKNSQEKSSPQSTILAYEVWTPLVEPNYFEDITLFLEKKLAAIREHKTQNFEVYERATQGMNAFRGAMQSGYDYAEAFQILRISQIF